MEIVARFALLAVLSAACGTVTPGAGDDDDGDGGGGDDSGPGSGEPDAGGPEVLHLFHTVPEADDATRLYVADVVDGAVQPARLLSGDPANPTAAVTTVHVSSDGQVVVYRADGNTDGEADVYLVRVDGDVAEEPVRLSDEHGGAYVVSSFLAPDGSHAIYGAGVVGGGYVAVDDYYLVDLEPAPGAPVPLGHGDYVYGGVLSEDGSRFAFIEDGVAYAVSLGASAPTAVRVSPEVGSARLVQSLALSSDGSRLAMAGDLTTDGVFELYLVDLSGPSPGPARKASRPLVAGGDVDAGFLGIAYHRFSPDGRWLAYWADARFDEVPELFVVDVSGEAPGSNARVSGDLVAGGEVSRSLESPFSPDGRMIAYRADQLSDDVSELFVADLSGGEPVVARRVNGPLPAGGGVHSFRFAPDSSGLGYRADQNTDDVVELYYADLRSGEPAAAQRVNANMVSGGDIASPLAFSADGRRLAFAGDLTVDERDEVYLAAIADGAAAPADLLEPVSAATSTISSIEFARTGSLVFVGNTARTNLDLWIADAGDETLGAPQRVNVTTARSTIRFWLRP
jgi:hypothetical protein